MLLDPYNAAAISLLGITFDSLGGLYLAYDLLGGEKGPLSKITRVVTYSLMAFVFYLAALNFKFALIAGIGMGSILGLQLDAIGAGKTKLSVKELVVIALGRMLAFGIAATTIVSPLSAVILGINAFAFSLLATKLKISPEYWYEASREPQFRPRRLVVGVALAIFVTLVAWFGETISGGSANPGALSRAAHLGLVVGGGTGLIAMFSPIVEWYADNLPPRRMGYIGVCLFMIGFFIQSLPSLFILLTR